MADQANKQTDNYSRARRQPGTEATRRARHAGLRDLFTESDAVLNEGRQERASMPSVGALEPLMDAAREESETEQAIRNVQEVLRGSP